MLVWQAVESARQQLKQPALATKQGSIQQHTHKLHVNNHAATHLHASIAQQDMVCM
jgi:hypothetical protein